MSTQRVSFFILFSSFLCFSIACAGKTGPVSNKRVEAKHIPARVIKPKPFLGKVTHSFESFSHSLVPRTGGREVVVYIEPVQFRNVPPEAFHSNNSSNFSHGSVSPHFFPFHKRYYKFRKHHHHRKHIHHESHSDSEAGTNSGESSNSGGDTSSGGTTNSGGKSNPTTSQVQSAQQTADLTRVASSGGVGNGNLSSSSSKGSIDRCRIDSNGVYTCDTRRMSME